MRSIEEQDGDSSGVTVSLMVPLKCPSAGRLAKCSNSILSGSNDNPHGLSLLLIMKIFRDYQCFLMRWFWSWWFYFPRLDLLVV